MIRRLLPFAVFAFMTLACSATESTAETESAVSAPWVCAPPTYDPLALPYTLGWCEWKPNPHDGTEPAGVSTCTGPTPQWSFDMYSSKSFAGQCARESILPGRTLAGNSRGWVTLNGWHTSLLIRDKPQVVKVQSFKLGPHTELIACDTDPGPGFSCPTGIGIGNSAEESFDVADWGVEGVPNFTMASFELLQF